MNSIPTTGTPPEPVLLHRIVRHCLDKRCQIESWFREQWRLTPAPFYSSVDLRNAHFKLAPVDTNLFPGGFNNLNQPCLPLAIQAASAMIAKQYPSVRSMVIVADSHTRHQYYFENVAVLMSIFSKAGFEVKVGTLLPITATKTIPLSGTKTLDIHPLLREGTVLSCDGLVPDLLVLNHDLSGGVPSVLQGISQPITPPLALGWAHRRKSRHFFHYDQVVAEFSSKVGLDPWLINPYFEVCDNVDFITGEGMSCLAASIDVILEKTRARYAEYHIDRDPFVVVKADAGTYGMGIMMVKSSEEILQLNRKQRSKMSQLKGGQSVNQVLVQEGVHTFETVGNPPSVAEPVVYLLGEHVVGGFYRIHTEKGIDDNLNAPGMQFQPLPFHTNCISPDCESQADEVTNQLYVYGLIARLATLAAAREIQEGIS